jgi:hypothetical protein
MFKKNFLLLCALTAAYAPVAAVAPECYREDEIVDVTKGKKCCRCCSLTVTNNASIGGNLSVGGTGTFGGSVTAARFITPSGGPLLNWAVLSNTAAVLTGANVLWGATSASSVTAGITNNAGTGVVTLPIGGTFLVIYTARFTFTAGPGSASAQLQQGSTGSGFSNISQAAVNNIGALALPATVTEELQLNGYAIVNTTSTANNQIQLPITLVLSATLPLTAVSGDANAELTIIQLI